MADPHNGASPLTDRTAPTPDSISESCQGQKRVHPTEWHAVPMRRYAPTRRAAAAHRTGAQAAFSPTPPIGSTANPFTARVVNGMVEVRL